MDWSLTASCIDFYWLQGIPHFIGVISYVIVMSLAKFAVDVRTPALDRIVVEERASVLLSES